MRLEGQYTIQHWDQKPWDEGAGLDEAEVTLEFSGDVSGSATTRYLMVALADGAEFTGLVLVTGAIDGRHGSFVMQETGRYNGVDTAHGVYTIIAGSGKGELASIRGSGAYVATHGTDAIEFAGHTWEPTDNRSATYILDAELD